MTLRIAPTAIAAACGLVGWGLLLAQSQPTPDLADYRTAASAHTATVRPAAAGAAGITGYLGAAVSRDSLGRLIVEEVQAGSPAATAGVAKGDVVTRVNGHAVKTTDAFREWVQIHGPGEEVKLNLMRRDQPLDVSVALAATSRPMKPNAQPAYFGAVLGEPKEGEGVLVDQVAGGSPAATAGMKVGDLLTRVDGIDLTRAARLMDLLAEKRPGDLLAFVVRRDGKDVELKATLAPSRGDGSGRAGFGGRGQPGGRGGAGGKGGEGRGKGGAPGGRAGFARGTEGPPPSAAWTKGTYRVAVIGIEYTDLKHNAQMTSKHWFDAILSRGQYQGKSEGTGRTVHGSLADYFAEQSYGRFRLEGKVFDWIEVSKKRAEYSQGSGTSNKSALLSEALDKVAARDGKDALSGYDGFLFIYAGDMRGGGGEAGRGGGRGGVAINRGALYYPHAGTFAFQDKRYPYQIVPEGGSQITPIGGFVKEFGRILGLPDLAARTENIGSEGLGNWCAMSNPLPTGRPQHYSPWAKEKLGWITPTTIDPTVKQKLVLAPIQSAATECFKVLVRPDGSEYFLLENRRRNGFDADLPGEGLLIWRVINDRPILEEAHGIEGPNGPTVQTGAVPFPSRATIAFTPDTTPSSRSPLGGGLPVRITDIRRLPDGRIAFHVGYEYY